MVSSVGTCGLGSLVASTKSTVAQFLVLYLEKCCCSAATDCSASGFCLILFVTLLSSLGLPPDNPDVEAVRVVSSLLYLSFWIQYIPRVGAVSVSVHVLADSSRVFVPLIIAFIVLGWIGRVIAP